MARDVLNISKYVIDKCCNEGKAISNLQLQKILYYMQGMYLAVFNKPLFDDEIIAWKFGPAIPKVYYTYNKYIADDIYERCPDIFGLLNFSYAEQQIIDKIIEQKRELSAWQLVELTHKEEPWRKAYANNISNIITQRSMKKYFIGEIEHSA